VIKKSFKELKIVQCWHVEYWRFCINLANFDSSVWDILKHTPSCRLWRFKLAGGRYLHCSLCCIFKFYWKEILFRTI